MILHALLLSLACAAQAKTLYTHFTSLSDTARGPQVIEDGMLLLTDAGQIESIGPFDPKAKAEKVVDLQGKWIVPGFISGHTHLWQSPFRGLAADKTLVPWIKARIDVIKKDRVAKDDFFYFTQHGALDLLQNGVTSVFSHAQALKDLGDYAPEQFAAECALPQRFLYGLPAKDIAYDDAKRRIESMQAAKKDGKCPALLGIGLSDAFFFASKIVGPERLQEHLRIQRDFDLPIEDHFLEEAEESKGERELYRKIMAGPYEPKWDRIILAHFIHPDQEILDHVQAKRIRMVWNPLSNGRLASGVPDIPEYLRRGIPVGMGEDGSASADLGDPFQNMRMGLYALRIQTHRADQLSPQQVFSLHTLGTARVLDLDAVLGSLEEGKAGDFVVLDPSDPSAGVSNDKWAQLVFAMSARNIESVYIGGKRAWHRGRFEGVDGRAVNAAAVERAAKHLR